MFEKGNQSLINKIIANPDEITNVNFITLGGGISKSVSNLDLGSFINKVGDYEVYTNGEVFYRAMSVKHYNRMLKGEGIIGTGETFTSPTLTYITQKGYNGIIVKFQMQPGTLASLKNKAIVNDNADKILEFFNNNLPPMSSTINDWTSKKSHYV